MVKDRYAHHLRATKKYDIIDQTNYLLLIIVININIFLIDFESNFMFVSRSPFADYLKIGGLIVGDNISIVYKNVFFTLLSTIIAMCEENSSQLQTIKLQFLLTFFHHFKNTNFNKSKV